MLTKKFNEGETYNIKGLDIHIPPVGYVYNRETDTLEYRGVFARSSIKKDQYWERQGYIDGYDKLLKAEKKRQETDPEYEDPTLAEFRNSCWDKRINGMWFYSNGTPTYITGLHWFYLEWVHMKAEDNNGYPSYWESDKKFFWFLQYVIDDPNALGMVYVTKRREGKSWKSVAFVLDPATRVPNMNCGIQSKTEHDAKTVVYMRGVVHAFSKLPEFFKPVYDTSAGSRPKNGLKFVNPSVKGKRAEEELAPELGGSITFKPSSETAYDGEKLGRYVGDEVFKSLIDVEERHRVVRFCLTDHNGKWHGKALYTSTVESIEGYINQYIDFWKKSDQEERGPTGKTKNGLYRYFLPSDEAKDRDKYGNCDVQKNREAIIAEREFVRSDRSEYNSIVRKEPLTIEEAFRSSGTTSMFNTVALADRIEALQWKQDEIYDIGNFYWKDGDKEGDVEWRTESNGRFKVRWDRCGEFTPNAMDGRFPTTKVPGNQIKFVGGCDPYDSRFTSDGRGSDGAFVLFRKYDINDVENSHSPCVTYSNRPPTPQMFYEDILMCCVFFGAQVLVENNKLGIIKHVDEYRHMPYYLMKLKGRKEYGIPAHDQSKELMSNLLVQYYYEHINKVDFVDLLNDSMDFDPTNTRKSDLTMAFGWALVGDKKLSVEQQKAKQERMRSVDIKEIFGKRRRRK